MPIAINLSLKCLRDLGFTPSLDPPKSPLRRGTLKRFLFPPSVGAVPPCPPSARGDLGLVVKQQSLTGFEIKLTLRKALGVSLHQNNLVGTKLC